MPPFLGSSRGQSRACEPRKGTNLPAHHDFGITPSESRAFLHARTGPDEASPEFLHWTVAGPGHSSRNRPRRLPPDRHDHAAGDRSAAVRRGRTRGPGPGLRVRPHRDRDGARRRGARVRERPHGRGVRPHRAQRGAQRRGRPDPRRARRSLRGGRRHEVRRRRRRRLRRRGGSRRRVVVVPSPGAAGRLRRHEPRDRDAPAVAAAPARRRPALLSGAEPVERRRRSSRSRGRSSGTGSNSSRRG